MTLIRINLRILGDSLPPEEEVTHLLGTTPTSMVRKGEHLTKKLVQAQDVCLLELFAYEKSAYEENPPWELIENQMRECAKKLRSILANMVTLDRRKCKADLGISMVIEEDQGGLVLPVELVEAAAAGGMSISISNVVVLDRSKDLSPALTGSD
jgi:hypothetical protein